MFGVLYDGRNRVPVQEIPVSRMHRVQQSFRRRLSDQIEDVLHRACIDDDLQTAEVLFKLLKVLQIRRILTYGTERRINNDGFVKAGQAVEQCRERAKRSGQTSVRADGPAEPYLAIGNWACPADKTIQPQTRPVTITRLNIPNGTST